MPPDIKLASLEKPDAALKEALQGFSGAMTEDLACLRDDTTKRIHDIRVGTKKIRALLLLAGKRVPKAETRILFGLLRQIRGAFAASRDTGVMRMYLDRILPEEELGPAMEKLGLKETDAPADIGEAIDWVSELQTRLEALDLGGLKTRHLLHEAAESHGRARKLRKKCRKLDDDVLMHTWRKRVKEFCYHTMALEDLKAMGKLTAKADELAETLGDYHDLALLSARAKNEPELLRVVMEAKERTGKRCLELAAKVFRTPPGKFEEKLFSQI